MQRFREWFYLNESMNVYVQGHDYHNDINDLSDLAEIVKRKVLDPAWTKLTPEQQEAVRKGGSSSHFMITPDGDYYSNTKNQTLNFYTTGWESILPNLIAGIKYFLDEMKVKYGPFRNEKSGMFGGNVVRIPILQFATTKNSPPMINLSNTNARLIFGELLGFPGNESGFSNISPADLYRKIEMLEKEQIDIHARDTYTQQNKNNKGPVIHHMGLSSEDIAQRLEPIKAIAKWALENHFDSIYVG
jgi:hypothetical protein